MCLRFPIFRALPPLADDRCKEHYLIAKGMNQQGGAVKLPVRGRASCGLFLPYSDLYY